LTHNASENWYPGLLLFFKTFLKHALQLWSFKAYSWFLIFCWLPQAEVELWLRLTARLPHPSKEKVQLIVRKSLVEGPASGLWVSYCTSEGQDTFFIRCITSHFWLGFEAFLMFFYQSRVKGRCLGLIPSKGTTDGSLRWNSQQSTVQLGCSLLFCSLMAKTNISYQLAGRVQSWLKKVCKSLETSSKILLTDKFFWFWFVNVEFETWK